MKIYQLLDALNERFVPMDSDTRLDLKIKSSEEYGKSVSALENKKSLIEKNTKFNLENSEKIEAGEIQPLPIPKLSIKDNVIQILEQWYMRYALAIAFIFLVPKIKSIMEGKKEDLQEFDETDSYEDYLEFKRFKNRR